MKGAKMLAAVDEIAPNTKQPREHFDEAALERLSRSLLRKQRAPIVVSPIKDGRRPKVKWMIVDGERRWRAAQMAGLRVVWITVDDRMDPEGDEMHEASLVANFCREGHTHAEKARALQKLLTTGRGVQEIADMVGKSNSWVSAEAGLLRLQPELLKLMDAPTPKEERIPLNVGYALSTVPPEKQVKIWLQHKHKATASAIHGVRLSIGEVRRDGSKDGEYMLGKLRNAHNQLYQLCEMPRAMMRNVSAAKRDAAWPLIEKIKLLLIQAGERLSTEISKGASHEAPDESGDGCGVDRDPGRDAGGLVCGVRALGGLYRVEARAAMKVTVMVTATGALPRKTVLEATGTLNAARAVLMSPETEALFEQALKGGGEGMLILSAFRASAADKQAHVDDVGKNGGEALLRLA